MSWHGAGNSFGRSAIGTMKRSFHSKAFVLSGIGLLLANRPTARAEEDLHGVTAVSSRVTIDYVRVKLPDGSYQPESYGFGKGGKWAGSFDDLTIDKMTFMDVARIIAVPLAVQKYIPDRDPKTTKLLVMVYWGTTKAPEHAANSRAYQRLADASNTMKAGPIVLRIPTGPTSSKMMVVIKPQRSADIDSGMMAALAQVDMENLQRDKVNQQNAAMLGYESWWVATEHFEHVGFGLDFERQDMIDELYPSGGRPPSQVSGKRVISEDEILRCRRDARNRQARRPRSEAGGGSGKGGADCRVRGERDDTAGVCEGGGN
jgi:hypothetical protein